MLFIAHDIAPCNSPVLIVPCYSSMLKKPSYMKHLLLVLTVCLLSAQWVYGAHAGEYLKDGHVHSIDCAVCLAKHNSAADLPSSFLFADYLPVVACSNFTVEDCFTAASTLPAIRAPPVSTH